MDRAIWLDCKDIWVQLTFGQNNETWIKINIRLKDMVDLDAEIGRTRRPGGEINKETWTNKFLYKINLSFFTGQLELSESL